MSEQDAKTVKSAQTKATVQTKAPTVVEEEEEEEEPKFVEEEESCKKFCWNPDKKEFLGRNGKSWMLITFFYIVFFGFLLAFFMMSWYISLQFLDHKEPFKNKDKSILYKNGPGLTFRPIPDVDKNKDSSLILVNPGSANTHSFWSGQLRNWFNNIPSSGKACGVNNGATKSEACKVDKTQFGPYCNGSDVGEFFGYNTGQPCILIKLNRVFYWKPGKEEVKKPPAAKTMYDSVTEKDGAFIWCQGVTFEDKMQLGQVEYYPSPMIPSYYFPYQGQKNYQSPFIMIRLASPTRGALITIECSAHSKHLKINKDNRVGYTRFQVLVGA